MTKMTITETQGEQLTDPTAEIEQRLAATMPEIEVLLVEVVGGDLLRVFIDHPEGVTLEHCEQVTEQLGALRERYAIEVSSPGQDRPLTRPAHYRRFLGQRAKLRLRDARDGHRTLTGELVGASDAEVTISVADGVVSIPYERIARSNLVPGD